jgi:hypothetical protein
MFAEKRATISTLSFLGRGWVFLYVICLFICVASIVAFTSKILSEVRATAKQHAKQDFDSLFSKPPFQAVEISDDTHSHGRNWFRVGSLSAPLVLQPGRSIREVGIHSGILGQKTDSWMTRCYYQPHDAYLTGMNGDNWIYTDDNFSRAFVTGLDTFEESRETLYPEFSRIFKTTSNNVNLPDYYHHGKTIYFEVWSPEEPLLLKEGQYFQSIDPQACKAEFPPRQRKEAWMTRCYYAPPDSMFGEAIWIFMNDSSRHAFVMANLRGQP